MRTKYVLTVEELTSRGWNEIFNLHFKGYNSPVQLANEVRKVLSAHNVEDHWDNIFANANFEREIDYSLSLCVVVNFFRWTVKREEQGYVKEKIVEVRERRMANAH